jgi:ribose/xylose/arabinose/galactoside ABC-type transport system permease subunit
MFAVLSLILAAISPEFRGRGNLQQVGLRTCVVAIMAVGQILVILTAGIDLSVGSVAALSAVVASLLMTDGGWPVPAAVAAGCLTGLGCGAVNGLLVTRGRIPPFIVTLGMMMVARGAAMLLAGATSVFGLPQGFRYLGGSQKIAGAGTAWIPISITLAIAAAFAVVLNHTRFGRALYATGGNLTGARLSGIRVDGVRVWAYMLCGMLAGFSGIMLAARTSIADPAGAGGYELDAIAACVIGGTSLMGGEGGALGVVAGALIMNVLVNFCNLNDISVHWQRVLVGTLIVALVYYDNFRKRRAGLLKDG